MRSNLSLKYRLLASWLTISSILFKRGDKGYVSMDDLEFYSQSTPVSSLIGRRLVLFIKASVLIKKLEINFELKHNNLMASTYTKLLDLLKSTNA